MAKALKTPPLDMNTPGLKAALRLCQDADPDPEHALQVCHNALALFDCLTDVHWLSKRERRLLALASLLHDTGWSNDPSRHYKGSRDFVLNADLDGVSNKDRNIVACVVRYHRKAHPKPTHKVFRNLPAKAQNVVVRLAAVLRIADGLDRTHAGAVEAVKMEREGMTVRLRIKQRIKSTADIWGALRKCRLFENVFGVNLEIVAEPQKKN